MKILFALSTFPPNFYGGGEVAAMNLAEWLRNQGHEIGFITAAAQTEAELIGATVNGMLVWKLRFPRPYTFWNHVKASKFLKPIWYLQDHFDIRNRRLMGKALDDFKPDLVLVHVIAGIGYNSLRAIGSRKVPAVYFLHDLSLACLWGGMFKKGSTCKGQCAECVLTSFIRFSCVKSIPTIGFCSPSRANLETVGRYVDLSKFPTASIFNPNKYPKPTIPVEPYEGTMRFLYVGRLHKTKGVGFLLDVLVSLASRYDFTIDLLGEGAESAELRERFSRYGWCRFRGHVAEIEVSNYIARSDLLCTPSIWAEPLGGVVVQALDLGLPVFGSRIGGIPELVRNNFNGLLIDPNDTVAWTAALISVLEQPSQLAEWRTNMLNAEKDFDQDINGLKMVEFFNTVVDSARVGIS